MSNKFEEIELTVELKALEFSFSLQQVSAYVLHEIQGLGSARKSYEDCDNHRGLYQ